MEEFLLQLHTSLENLTVKGKDNLDILLGCLLAIERKISELNTSNEEESE